MKPKYFIQHLLVLVLFFFSQVNPLAANSSDNPDEMLKLQNPMSVSWLKKNLRKNSPRLVLNSTLEKQLKNKVKNDPVIGNVYQAIKLNAEQIQKEPLLERIVTGRRLLSVSREMLYRSNMLGMVYRMEKDPAILQRIDQEVQAVCNFSDWNPSHYLDVAEMSLAVALALDWTAGDLPASTQKMAKTALIEKGIKPSYNERGNTGWVKGNNNWNQVCHGGMIAAAIVIAEDDPELASRTLHRALEGIPYAMVEYAPHGVYPEGATYWSYGTSFTVMTIAMLESAFGTDFGLGNYPAFKESAVFKALSNAPSGWYYNFADCGDKRSQNGDFTLAWFAKETGNPAFFEKERFMQDPASMGRLSRESGAALVWLSQFESSASASLPTAWKGEGSNPVIIFTGGPNDQRGYYFGGKGGRGTVNHGNMDAGSFIFELDGVRWSVDPGNQSYHELEKTGFNLWGKCQDCERWKLLTKNNYGHSTITVNDQLHVVDGLATISNFTENGPEATIDLTPAFGSLLKSASRRFVKEGDAALLIEDMIEVSDETELITWQMMTTADVEVTKAGAILRQDGKMLRLENLSHPDLLVSVISVDPAPLELDRQMENLKRLEIRIPAWTIEGGKTKVSVRLVGE